MERKYVHRIQQTRDQTLYYAKSSQRSMRKKEHAQKKNGGRTQIPTALLPEKVLSPSNGGTYTFNRGNTLPNKSAKCKVTSCM